MATLIYEPIQQVQQKTLHNCIYLYTHIYFMVPWFPFISHAEALQGLLKFQLSTEVYVFIL